MGRITDSQTRPGLGLLLFMLVISTLACGTFKHGMSNASTDSSPAPASSISMKARLGIFEEAWQVINDEYYDPNFKGVNWQQVRERYRPRVEQTRNDDEFIGLMETMLSELKDAHTGFIPPQTNQAPTGPPGRYGLALGEVEGKTVVTEVLPGSDAERAGVKPGMILLNVNGRPIEQIFTEMRAAILGSSTEGALKNIMLSALLYGSRLGPQRTLTLQGFTGQLMDVKLERSASYAPPIITARTLPTGQGYIKVDQWQPPVAEQFKQELAKLMNAPALIIDLRGNSGGSGDEILAAAANFFSQPTSLGWGKTRSGKLEAASQTRVPEQVYKAPVVILVDERTASAAEVFTVFLQEKRAASAVGRPTCGCTLNDKNRPLKDGGILHYSFRSYISPKGREVEGTGVLVDKNVPLTLTDLRAGRDAVLETALEMLKTTERAAKTNPQARLKS